MWNDTDIPLAYLITFRGYATWLHGDSRGSIDRFNNRYRGPFIPENPLREESNKKKLIAKEFKMNAKERRAVGEAIRETCTLRKWDLIAINVRTNHAHVVVAIGAKKPSIALNSFKANATRKLRENGLWNDPHSPWADKGSKRGLWNEKSIASASEYVISGQGGDLPDFD